MMPCLISITHSFTVKLALHIHFVSKSAEVDIAAILRDFVKFSLVTAVDDHGGSGFSTIGLTHVIV